MKYLLSLFLLLFISISANAGVELNCESVVGGESYICDIIPTGSTQIQSSAWSATFPLVVQSATTFTATFRCASHNMDGAAAVSYVTNDGSGSASHVTSCTAGGPF